MSLVWETVEPERVPRAKIALMGRQYQTNSGGVLPSATSLEFRRIFFVYNVSNSNDCRRRTSYLGNSSGQL